MHRDIKAAVSNGSYKFHLAPLAAELAKAGMLVRFYTAGYTKRWMYPLLRVVPMKRVQRLLQRTEPIAPELVSSCWPAEIVFKLGDLFRRFSRDLQQRIHCRAFSIYAANVTRDLRDSSASVYHFRSCYGVQSIEAARRKGMVTLCDHSIGHPSVNTHMVLTNGEWPTGADIRPRTPLEFAMLDDINAADHVVVNSDFVKTTFVHAGYPADKVSVIYWGIDQQFADMVKRLTPGNRAERNPATDLLFAGGFGVRKGARVLMAALRRVPNWNLSIAGGIEPEVIEEFEAFCRDYPGRVNRRGFLSRKDLAEEMFRHQVFVFPTFLEGSARVVFEALAAGCFVITTANAGSIVDEACGRIVPPGDVEKLRESIQAASRAGEALYKIALRSQKLILEQYTQEKYALSVRHLYAELLARQRMNHA